MGWINQNISIITDLTITLSLEDLKFKLLGIFIRNFSIFILKKCFKYFTLGVPLKLLF